MRHAIGYDAPTHLRDSVFGVVGHDPNVGLQGNRQADPNGVPVDRRDDRGAQLERGRICGGGGNPASSGGASKGSCRHGEVGAGTERITSPGEHDRAHRIVVVALPVGTASRVPISAV